MGARFGSHDMYKLFDRWTRIGVTCALLLLSGAAMAIEEPAYRVVTQDGSYEVRTYGARIVAETWVTGNLSEASSAGFRKVAGYIFGKNRQNDGKSASIAMTAPVTVSPVSRSSSALAGPMSRGR